MKVKMAGLTNTLGNAFLIPIGYGLFSVWTRWIAVHIKSVLIEITWYDNDSLRFVEFNTHGYYEDNTSAVYMHRLDICYLLNLKMISLTIIA